MNKNVKVKIEPGTFMISPKEENELAYELFQFEYRNCSCPGVDATPMSTHLTWGGAHQAMQKHMEEVLKIFPDALETHYWGIKPIEVFE